MIAAYALCAGLATGVLRLRPEGTMPGLWRTVVVICLLLALNRTFDLLEGLTALGRCDAERGGWYASRRLLQWPIVVGLGLASVAVLRALMVRHRQAATGSRLALVGLPLLCGYVLIRAVGFHYIDRLIALRIGGLTLNFLFEGTFLVLLMANAVALLRRRRARAGTR